MSEVRAKQIEANGFGAEELRNKITIKLYKRGGSTRLEFAFSSNRKQNLLVGYLSSCCWQVQRGPAI